jgi:hypothetical protein
VAALDRVNGNKGSLNDVIADGIKFKDMNAGHLVSRLAMIEQDPEIVWKALCENFGSDFFVD